MFPVLRATRTRCLRAASHVGAFVAGAAFATAALAHALPGLERPRAPHDSAAETFAEALRHIDRYYVEPVAAEVLAHDAIASIVSTLDDHSAFLGPSDYRRLKEDTGGAYSGIGISLARGGDGEIVIDRVIAESPAARAGIVRGDRVLAVDGVAATELGERAPRRFEERLRGTSGSRVVLHISRADEELEIVLEREPIAPPSVEWTVIDDEGAPAFGIVVIERFHEGTGREVARALGEIARRTGYPMPGVVLDLRGNPGGLLDAAIDVADLFLDRGIIARVRGRGGAIVSQWQARDAGTFEVPLIVLVDRQSASAAEVLAGSLQDHGRAIVAGSASYGKGSVQTLFDLPGGSGLRLTTSHYYTPAHRAIDADGLAPDIRLPDDVMAGPTVASDTALDLRWRRDGALTWAVETLTEGAGELAARGPGGPID